MSDQTAANKKVVLDWFETAFIQRNPEAAARDFMGATYTQHNPQVPDGKEAFVGAIGGMFGAFPDFAIEKKRVIGEADFVVIHSHVKMSKDDRGMAVADIFRLEGGKIVEHWDILQPIPETAENNNTMF